jgi:hypothetical protein
MIEDLVLLHGPHFHSRRVSLTLDTLNKPAVIPTILSAIRPQFSSRKYKPLYIECNSGWT